MSLIENYRHYFSNIIIMYSALLFYNLNNYYSNFLKDITKDTLLYLILSYTIIGFLHYSLNKNHKISNGTYILQAIKKIIIQAITFFKKFDKNPKHIFPKLEEKEKYSLLFLLVKIFFLPLMLNFLFGNYNSFTSQITHLKSIEFTISYFNHIIFPFTLTTIFLIDVAYFAFGYLFEAKFLKNELRSVDSTFLGWFVALICYPPFNSYYTDIVGWYANDYLKLSTDLNTFILRILILLSFFVYIAATISLGTKCSNLTNRGIIQTGIYRFVRHPAYIAKNIGWWLTVIPILSINAFLGMLAWTFIYYLRAITEEKHLSKDKDYIEYCKKVKYKFIPHIW